MTDILGLIDGALEDWTTSGDAMRWAPQWDEPIVHPARIGPERLVAQGWDGYAATAYAAWSSRHVFKSLTDDFARITSHLAAFGEAFVQITQTVKGFAPTLRLIDEWHSTPPIDVAVWDECLPPRERALRARRNRHTGPAAPRMDGRR